MKSVIIHADGRHTDLSAAVDPGTYAELETGRYPRTPAALWCGSCGGSIHIRHGAKRTSELFGVHHRASDCGADLTIHKSQMSDEHKRQAEYHVRAAEQAGYAAAMEVRTTGHTRVDVVVNGATGFEVQRSAIKKASAVDRTARSIAAGLTSVTWFTDRTSTPQWNGHVPGYRTTMPPEFWWQTRPGLRTVTAAGLRIIEAVKCGTRGPCPHQRHGTCGRFTAASSPWLGLLVDDVVAGLAAGHIQPVQLGAHVQLLSTASIDLYEELTGTRLSYSPGLPKVALPPTAREACLGRLQVPEAAPAAVREWFEAELARVQQDREERERVAREELEEQVRREQAERDRRLLLEREREERERQYQEMQRLARERRERLAHEQFERDRLARLALEREQAERDRRLHEQLEITRWVGPCARCHRPCNRYGPNGTPLCGDCKPKTIRQLGDGTN